MSKTEPDQYDERAAELLPCLRGKWEKLCGHVHTPITSQCPATYRHAVAAALREAANRIAVCDCHTWPTVSEMHDYCVAIEERNAALEQQERELRNAIEAVKSRLDDILAELDAHKVLDSADVL